MQPDILIHILLAILDTEPYMIYNLLWLNDGIILLPIMWKDTFNICIESWIIVVICSRELVIKIQNVFTTVWFINIYLYDIMRAYQPCILPYSTRVSLPRKFAYSNIQAYPPHVYHVANLSHYWENMRTVTYRHINTVCTI